MDDQIRPYVTITGANRPLDTPCLRLDIHGNSRFLCTIRRLPTQGNSDSRPCLFHWCPVAHGFVPGGFILLRHVRSADERIRLQRVEIAPDPEYNPALVQSESVQVSPLTSRLWELKTGDSVSFRTRLPGHWERQLQPGTTYELLWPGGTIALWEWGTIKGHLDEELRPCSQSGRNPIELPGGARTLLSVDSMPSLPLPEVSPKPVGDMDRVPEAPTFSVELQCPRTIYRQGPFQITGKVHYHRPSSSEVKAIAFHTWIFTEDFCLYQRKGNELVFIDTDPPIDGYAIYNDPDVLVNVATRDDFTTLQPGESWEFTWHLQGQSWTSIPRDAHVGETFCVRYNGGTVDWWEWGGKEDHAHTTVALPCHQAGRVVDPADNEGRPRLVIPASNLAEITLADSK